MDNLSHYIASHSLLKAYCQQKCDTNISVSIHQFAMPYS
jgi:hypothetical protein